MVRISSDQLTDHDVLRTKTLLEMADGWRTLDKDSSREFALAGKDLDGDKILLSVHRAGFLAVEHKQGIYRTQFNSPDELLDILESIQERVLDDKRISQQCKEIAAHDEAHGVGQQASIFGLPVKGNKVVNLSQAKARKRTQDREH